MKTKRAIYTLAMLVLIAMILEAAGELMMWYSDNIAQSRTSCYKSIRKMLMNDATPEDYPIFLPQANLNYVNYPGYTDSGIVINNRHGYRGNEYSVIPPPRTLRLLFIGGSTTWGYKIKDFKKTYPFQTKIILDSLLKVNSSFQERYDSIECINAGLAGAISTEELTHYLFKFRYYQPGMVIIKPGLNECEYKKGTFQPDYTHLRNVDFNIKALPGRTRWLMHSRFFSALIINLFYIDYLNYGYILENEGNAYTKYCKWFPGINVDSLNRLGDYTFTPFYQNISMLVDAVQRDSAIAVLMTSPLNEQLQLDASPETAPYYENNLFNNSLIRKIAAEKKCLLIDIAYSDIKDESWIDDCHVDAQGNYVLGKITAHQIKDTVSMFHYK